VILRLKRGTAVLDLSAEPYHYGPDFAPPPASYQNSFSSGTAVNTGGDVLVARRATSREWSFQLLVTGATLAGIEVSIQRLEQFLSLVSLTGEDTYLEYSSLDIPEPCTGWFGAVKRYKVLAANSPQIGDIYGNAIAREEGVYITLTLTIAAHALGPARPVAFATGTVTEDITGQASGQPAGLKVAASSSVSIARAIGSYAEQAAIVSAGGAILFVWKPETANTASGDKFLFENNGGSTLECKFESDDDKFYFVVGSNTISSSAQTFAAGDTLRLLFTWGSTNKLKIYRDGTQIASGSSFTAPSDMTSLFIGSNASGANQCLGNFTITIWPSEPTLAQVAEIDAAAASILAAGGRVDYLPWMWTESGTTALDTFRDSDEDNRAIVAGIPGSAPAKYRATLTHSAAATVVKYLNCYQHPYERGAPASTDFYDEVGGSSESGNSNGDYASLATSGNSASGLPLLPTLRGVAALARMKLSGTAVIGLSLTATIDQHSVTGGTNSPTVGTDYGFYWVPPVYLVAPRDLPYSVSTFTMLLTPSATVTRLDYVQYLPLGTLLKFSGTGTLAGPSMLFDAVGVIRVNATGAEILGQTPQLCPGAYNVISHVEVLATGQDGWLQLYAVAPAWGLL